MTATIEPALTARRVQDTMKRVLFQPHEIAPGARRSGMLPAHAVKVEAIGRTFAFHPTRLAAERAGILAMLAELPDAFRALGGAPLALARTDRTGREWGDPLTFEELVALGLGVGAVRFTVCRSFWSSLPDGLPRIRIDTSDWSLARDDD